MPFNFCPDPTCGKKRFTYFPAYQNHLAKHRPEDVRGSCPFGSTCTPFHHNHNGAVDKDPFDGENRFFPFQNNTEQQLPHKLNLRPEKIIEFRHPTGGSEVTESIDDFDSDLEEDDPDGESYHNGKPRMHRTRRGMTAEEQSQYDNLDPRYAPFSCEESFNLAEWIIAQNLPQRAVDKLLRDNHGVSAKVTEDFSSYHTLRRKLDMMPDGLGWSTWHRKGTGMSWSHLHSEEITFWMRNPLRVARFLVSQPAYRKYLKYCPYTLTNPDGTRVYRDMDSAEWWWEQQVSATFIALKLGSNPCRSPLKLKMGDEILSARSCL